jgi:hypothetical protein
MTVQLMPDPAATVSSASSALAPYHRWYLHFSENSGEPRHGTGLPWHDPYQLSASERRSVATSLQQFQLGEWARGRGLVRRAASHPRLAADPWFVPALQLFIAEEQAHSALLGRFLDRERLPRLKQHWVDAFFRRLRKLAGLEICIAVLVTAEVLAMPFYQALRDATHSSLLRSICRMILCDEAAHLQYQALTLGLLRRPLGARARSRRAACHAAFFYGTALLLWQQHRTVFAAAGWSFFRFWTDAGREFRRLQTRIRQVSQGREPADDRRLD